jgi:hypothetical protein
LTVKKKHPPRISATIIRHEDRDSISARRGIVKAADYAFGSNPPYGLNLNASDVVTLRCAPPSARLEG